MKIKKSDLNFEDFKVMACSFTTVQADKRVSTKELKEIPIDFDFDILFNKKNSSKFKILLQFESNNSEKPVPGYIYSIICESSFTLKRLSKMTDEKKDQFLLFTALPLTVSMVRSYLYSMSASYPHSHYLLPSIDLVDLINHKFKKK